MIPRHRPPFGILALISTAIRSLFSSPAVAELERRYRQHLAVRHAVWIPSARYGITRSVQEQTATEAAVVCPVFNCGAVHHAVSACQRPVRFADCSSEDVLMDCTGPADAGHAIILSEMFGHRFSADHLRQPLVQSAALRVFDMAMAVPTAADLERMQHGDVTLLSFGLGKSLYAGWGGMALTNCNEMAAMLRRRLAHDLTSPAGLTRTKWNTELLARTVAHEPLIYGTLRARRMKRVSDRHNAMGSFSEQSAEWCRPPTRLHLTRSIDNLLQSESFIRQRTELCREYRNKLCDSGDAIRLPLQDSAALSHFCVRVSELDRDSLRRQLWNSGMDVGTLFPFPHDICRADQFPNAAQSSAEILNLPLSNQLSRREVNRICDTLKKITDAGSGSMHHTARTRAA